MLNLVLTINGNGIDPLDMEGACTQVEQYLDENEGDDVSIAVRPTKDDEVEGLYKIEKLGLVLFEDPPQHIVELIDRAIDNMV